MSPAVCVFSACFILQKTGQNADRQPHKRKGRAMPVQQVPVMRMKMNRKWMLLLAAALLLFGVACRKPVVTLPMPTLTVPPTTTAPATTAPPQTTTPPAATSPVTPAAPTRATPTGVVTLLLQSVQKLDFAASKACMTTGEENNFLAQIDKLDAMGLSFVRTHLEKVTWEVTGEDINGNTATVTVAIEAPDLGPAIGKIMGAVPTYIAKQLFTGGTVDLPGFLKQYVRDNIKTEDMKTKEMTADIVTRKQADGTWLVDSDKDINFAMFDALTGGAGETLKNAMDMAADYLK